jgi:hypothetical protein
MHPLYVFLVFFDWQSVGVPATTDISLLKLLDIKGEK